MFSKIEKATLPLDMRANYETIRTAWCRAVGEQTDELDRTVDEFLGDFKKDQV